MVWSGRSGEDEKRQSSLGSRIRVSAGRQRDVGQLPFLSALYSVRSMYFVQVEPEKSRIRYHSQKAAYPRPAARAERDKAAAKNGQEGVLSSGVLGLAQARKQIELRSSTLARTSWTSRDPGEPGRNRGGGELRSTQYEVGADGRAEAQTGGPRLPTRSGAPLPRSLELSGLC